MEQSPATPEPPHQAFSLSYELEWPALIAGCLVGTGWWMLHRVWFVDLYWTLAEPFKNMGFVVREFDLLYAALNLQFAFAQAVTVGLVVGLLARQQPYVLTCLAIALTFISKVFVFDVAESFTRWGNPARPAYETLWSARCLALVYLAVPLLGAYLAQKSLRWMRRRQASAGQ